MYIIVRIRRRIKSIDVIIIAFIAAMMFFGYKKGFVKMAFHFAGFFIALFLAGQIAPHTTQFLYKTSIPDKVEQKVYDSFGGQTRINVFSDSNMPGLLTASIDQVVNDAVDKARHAAVEAVSAFIVGIIGQLLSYILCYLLVQIAAFVLDFIFTLPVLTKMNRAAGTLTGLLNGVIIVSLFLAAAGLLFADHFAPNIDGSVVANYIYHNNIIISLLLN